jgi:hypothetical protein
VPVLPSLLLIVDLSCLSSSFDARPFTSLNRRRCGRGHVVAVDMCGHWGGVKVGWEDCNSLSLSPSYSLQGYTIRIPIWMRNQNFDTHHHTSNQRWLRRYDKRHANAEKCDRTVTTGTSTSATENFVAPSPATKGLPPPPSPTAITLLVAPYYWGIVINKRRLNKVTLKGQHETARETS